MQPVLYHLTGNTPGATAVVYALALLIFLYALWTGWKSAKWQSASPKPVEGKPASEKPVSKKSAKGKSASGKVADGKVAQAGGGKQSAGIDLWPLIRNGIFGLGIAGLGLWYILPEVPLLGKTRGEGLPIPGYGFLVMLGFVAATAVFVQLSGREWLGEEGRRRREQVLDLSFFIFVGAMVGARLLYIVVNLSQYAKNPGALFSLQSGMVFYGGLIGAALVAFFFARKRGIPFLRLADVAMPAISLGQCLGRLGCFAASCCHGHIVGESSRWGVHFPGNALTDLAGNPSPHLSQAFLTHMRDRRWVDLATGKISEVFEPGLVQISEWAAQNDLSLPVHPVQLYESAGQFLLFVLFLWMRSMRRFHGQIFGMWLIAYALLRGTVEMFRGDLERGTLQHFLSWLGLSEAAAKLPLEAWYNISTSQAISMGLAMLGTWVLVHGWKTRTTTPPLAAA